LQTLHRHQVSQEEQADFHRFMLEDLDRLDRLINQLLDAGRSETPGVDRELEDVALAGLLRDCGNTICLGYRVPPETIRFDLDPCTVRALRVDLDVLFRNLLDNAVKYAGDEPQVEVTLRAENNGRALVRVADNGRGIPVKLRRRIFRRFERVGSELERDKPGTGLGLYIVRNLARRLGAKIRVRDRDGGPGTVFEVHLRDTVADGGPTGAGPG
jgi:signal transduction histidine kinase